MVFPARVAGGLEVASAASGPWAVLLRTRDNKRVVTIRVAA